MVETDLSFTHYLPNAHADEDFLVTALTHRGELWLVDNMDTTSNAPERQEFIPAGNAWAASREEFDQLLDKARTDGLLVSLETVEDDESDLDDRRRVDPDQRPVVAASAVEREHLVPGHLVQPLDLGRDPRGWQSSSA